MGRSTVETLEHRSELEDLAQADDARLRETGLHQELLALAPSEPNEREISPEMCSVEVRAESLAQTQPDDSVAFERPDPAVKVILSLRSGWFVEFSYSEGAREVSHPRLGSHKLSSESEMALYVIAQRKRRAIADGLNK